LGLVLINLSTRFGACRVTFTVILMVAKRGWRIYYVSTKILRWRSEWHRNSKIWYNLVI